MKAVFKKYVCEYFTEVHQTANENDTQAGQREQVIPAQWHNKQYTTLTGL